MRKWGDYENDCFMIWLIMVDSSKQHKDILVCFLSKLKNKGGFKNLFGECSIRIFVKFFGQFLLSTLNRFMISGKILIKHLVQRNSYHANSENKVKISVVIRLVLLAQSQKLQPHNVCMSIRIYIHVYLRICFRYF